MANKSPTVVVKLLDREYQIACTPEEQDDLRASAAHVDSKMREIQSSGKIVALDRIAVMTALNIAHELVVEKRTKSNGGDLSHKIRAIQHKIHGALQEFEFWEQQKESAL